MAMATRESRSWRPEQLRRSALVLSLVMLSWILAATLAYLVVTRMR